MHRKRSDFPPLEQFMKQRSMQGFSLIEMMAALGIGLIATAITFMTLQPALKQQHVTNAYNTTMMALRQARDQAVAQRMAYQVTFNAGNSTITIAPLTQLPGLLNATYTLPQDVQFRIEPGVPQVNAQVPDRFGTAAHAIDFGVNTGAGGLTSVFFYPDGSAQDSVNNICNGIVYMARPNELLSSRAITVWGATGRIRGWRLYQQGSNNVWQQQ
jgi:prepilin-type N-terminal cleavage/methylation domain-containing protein